jgi:hypothetical protein
MSPKSSIGEGPVSVKSCLPNETASLSGGAFRTSSGRIGSSLIRVHGPFGRVLTTVSVLPRKSVTSPHEIHHELVRFRHWTAKIRHDQSLGPLPMEIRR